MRRSSTTAPRLKLLHLLPAKPDRARDVSLRQPQRHATRADAPAQIAVECSGPPMGLCRAQIGQPKNVCSILVTLARLQGSFERATADWCKQIPEFRYRLARGT